MCDLNCITISEYLVLEQVCVAALDCNRLPVAKDCIDLLEQEFPGSLRVLKYHAMHMEALEKYYKYLSLENILFQCTKDLDYCNTKYLTEPVIINYRLFCYLQIRRCSQGFGIHN